MWGDKMMELQFTSPREHPPGTVTTLLMKACAPLRDPLNAQEIHRFGLEVSDYPDTVGASTFITCLKGTPIGMGSYDPRQMPTRGIIGWNCIIPEYQGKGYGKRQILEIIRILHRRGAHTICVTTSHEEFYSSAQHTYESCGFVRVRRTEGTKIDYELKLKSKAMQPTRSIRG